jgi:hypothetical protein
MLSWSVSEIGGGSYSNFERFSLYRRNNITAINCTGTFPFIGANLPPDN